MRYHPSSFLFNQRNAKLKLRIPIVSALPALLAVIERRISLLLSLLVAAGLLSCSAPEKSSDEPEITFRVLPRNLPDTAKIYITGNHAQLGEWHAGRISLTKQADHSWSRTFSFPAGTRLEYKFTRGAWQSEAVSAEGLVPQNFVLHINNDTTITIHIANWRDFIYRTVGQITGTVKYHRQMDGEGLEPRDVIVWLPPSYETSAVKRYPALYMHDGQNVFDPSTSFLGADWQVDEVADSLTRTGQMHEIIVIGIYNTNDRTAEYSDTDKGRSYMRFVAEKLKPFIDANYRTRPDREHSAIMGSSMGGLITLLLVWNYPHLFSQAACLSPAFIPPFDTAVRMVENEGGEDKKIRLYLDNGGVALDSVLQAGCESMVAALQKKGFKTGENFEWYRDLKAEHNERAWAQRVWRPLLFMFGKTSSKKMSTDGAENAKHH